MRKKRLRRRVAVPIICELSPTDGMLGEGA